MQLYIAGHRTSGGASADDGCAGRQSLPRCVGRRPAGHRRGPAHIAAHQRCSGQLDKAKATAVPVSGAVHSGSRTGAGQAAGGSPARARRGGVAEKHLVRRSMPRVAHPRSPSQLHEPGARVLLLATPLAVQLWEMRALGKPERLHRKNLAGGNCRPETMAQPVRPFALEWDRLWDTKGLGKGHMRRHKKPPTSSTVVEQRGDKRQAGEGNRELYRGSRMDELEDAQQRQLW